ncbi:hypothetical protein [Schleiferilactobacillus harbinensis]|uniref:Uncharacterized protein n=1 Tax=Schleiferilactobacillus harbinensis TaxID=304207 RepID=A0A5P8M3C1_9LACO|nr:hypothetical protein [Schleiferilactobacillus harbinensis]QFR22990.1 hypothetical protein D1010_05780 [Schleiferilactobacillus harbinensis]
MGNNHEIKLDDLSMLERAQLYELSQGNPFILCILAGMNDDVLLRIMSATWDNMRQTRMDDELRETIRETIKTKESTVEALNQARYMYRREFWS